MVGPRAPSCRPRPWHRPTDAYDREVVLRCTRKLLDVIRAEQLATPQPDAAVRGLGDQQWFGPKLAGDVGGEGLVEQLALVEVDQEAVGRSQRRRPDVGLEDGEQHLSR